MKKYISIFFICLSCLFKTNSCAQTPYTSQNIAITNYLNPAGVGFGVNHNLNSFFRNQFAGVGDAYKTIGIAADFKLFKKEYDEPNTFGMGIQAVSERVLNGALQTNYITLNFANRIFFNQLKTKSLSLGIGASYISRNIDRTQLSFGDQFNSGRLFFNSTADYISDFPSKYATNVGLMYISNSPNRFIQYGASSYYIFRTAVNQSYSNVNQNFQMNYLFNLEQRIMEDKTILFHADYQERLEVTNYYVGMAMGFPIPEKNDNINRLYLGCFYRSMDAIIPYVGILLNKYKFGISYDIYQNNMTASNLRPQTLEFNLTGFLGRNKSNNLVSIF
jgi:type IX secretion system PorP/SprF family membrane protein